MAQNHTYHEQVNIDNELKLRELQKKLPWFCKDFFRGIEPTTSSRTRIAYAYDLGIFFNYIKTENPKYSNINISELDLDILDKLTATDIEEYLEYLKYYISDDGKEHTNSERGIMRKLASVRTLYNYFYRKELIKNNPASIVSMPKLHDKEIIRLDVDEVAELLDEVEKAHPDILNVLLQVMDYATLSDNQGRKADFRNVLLIMTSNAGAKDIGKSVIGFGDRIIKGEAIKEEIKKFFTPEFRNRLDKIVVFNHLNEEMALNIAKRELDKFNEILSKKNVKVNFDDKCIDFVAKKGISQEYGAREILRVINQEIKPMFVDEILFGKLSDGGEVAVTVNNDKFIYS